MMSIFILTGAMIGCAVMVYTAVSVVSGMKSMRILRDIAPFKPENTPRVSIIVPACNEESNIEKALLSLLSQQYENFEVIVIDDRSTDGTEDILNRLQQEHPQLVIKRVKDLRDGWMGKSNAMSVGASTATGRYLLFTDADCVMEKSTVARAVSLMVGEGVDHLSLIFRNSVRGWLLDGLILDAGIGLFLVFKPWRVKEKNSRFFVGVGAFNMIEASVYRAIGGHETIKMHPIDDMMLGKIVKKHGYIQECLLGGDFISVPWYETVWAMNNGMMKNIFSIVHYRLLLVPFLIAGVLLVYIFPLWGIVFAEGFTRLLCSIILLVRTAIFYGGIKYQGLPAWYVLGSLITPYITLFIIVRAAVTTLLKGGIEWRGTLYSLKDLKKSEPILF